MQVGEHNQAGPLRVLWTIWGLAEIITELRVTAVCLTPLVPWAREADHGVALPPQRDPAKRFYMDIIIVLSRSYLDQVAYDCPRRLRYFFRSSIY